jgi:hypothetical protein
MLHRIIQSVIGWEDAHLYQFRVGEKVYSGPEMTDDDVYDPPIMDERKAMLSQIAPTKVDRFLYDYDFGDGWVHDVLVEDIIDPEPDHPYPLCLDGERACPPEDCGGPPGYEDMLEALADSKHPEHREFLDWIGDDQFDPETFDLERANATLGKIG